MNITWLDINSSWSHSSLAIPALNIQLKDDVKNKCNFTVISGTIKSNQSQIIQQIINSNPEYIFSTAWLFNIDYIRCILAKISNLLNLKGIFLGGPEFLGNNKHFLESNNYITAVFKGEGEEMFNSFISSLLNKDESWKQIKGFEYLYNSNYHISNSVYIKNFLNLKFPEDSEYFQWNKSFVQLETSRGCFNSCKFCISGIDRSKVQNLPMEVIKHRIDNIVAHNIHQIRILDRTFNANPQRSTQMLNLFKEYAGKVQFHLEIHPALLKSPFKETLSTLPDNLIHVEAGMQTLQQDVLDACDRKGTCSEALDGLKYLIDLKKFEVHADLISGLPKYTYPQIVSDVFELIKVNPAEIQLETLKLLHGTYFRNMSENLNIKYSPLPPYEVLQTECMSYRDINKSMVLSKILDYWYNDIRWQKVFVEIFSKNVEDLFNFIEYVDCEVVDFMLLPLSFENKGLLLYKYCKMYHRDFAKNISLEWVKNGLSLKKEPAENVILWEYKSEISNPLFNSNNVRDKYYYIEINGVIHWFAYNKEINRTEPYNYIQIS